MNSIRSIKAPFSKGEKILCISNGQPYEAKINAITCNAKGDIDYNIHYVGFNKKHDESVSLDRLVKFIEGGKRQNDDDVRAKEAKRPRNELAHPKNQTIDFKKRLAEEVKIAKARAKSKEKKENPRKGGFSPLKVKSSPPSTTTRNKKRRDNRTSGCNNKATSCTPQWSTLSPLKVTKKGLKKIDVDAINHHSSLRMPANLLQWLNYDWQQTESRGRKLFVPARITVVDVIDTFSMHQKQLLGLPLCKPLDEFIFSLNDAFGKILTRLLNLSEYSDFKDFPEETRKEFNTIFGSFHLLRLMGMIFDLDYEKRYSGNEKEIFVKYCNELLEFMDVNEAKFFRPIDYVVNNEDTA